MATRSPTEFHNDWGQFSFTVLPDDLLPNTPASPVQSQALEVGDTATVLTVPPSKWYCINPALGSAQWVQLSTGAAGQDITPFRITVGCAAAPYNDTSAICDILDPGDGSGIAAAIALANTFSNQPNPTDPAIGVEVFLRAGVYDLNQPGSPTAPFFLAAGTSLIGAASASVTISCRTEGDQGFAVKEGAGRLSGFRAGVLLPQSNPGSGSATLLLLRATNSSPDFNTLIIEDVALFTGDIDRATQSLRSCIDFENVSGTDAVFLGVYLHDCIFFCGQSPATPSTGPTDNIAAIRCFRSVVGTETFAKFDLTDSIVIGTDAALYLEDIGVWARDCLMGSGNDVSSTVYCGYTANNSRLNNCTVFNQGSPGDYGVVVDGSTAIGDVAQLKVDNCTFIGSGTQSIGIYLRGTTGATVTATTVRGFVTGIDASGVASTNNVVLGNNFVANTIPANVNLANNEFAHNVV